MTRADQLARDLEQQKRDFDIERKQAASKLSELQRDHAKQVEQLHLSFEAQKAQVLDANSTSQFCIDETEFTMQKEVIAHLTQQVEQLNEQLAERENELAETNEMVAHLEFEGNRQFNHFSQEIKHKEEVIAQA